MDENAFEVDFGALDFPLPRLSLSSSVGNGLSFVSSKLGGRLNDNQQSLVDYLLSLEHQGEVSIFLFKINWFVDLFPCINDYFEFVFHMKISSQNIF